MKSMKKPGSRNARSREIIPMTRMELRPLVFWAAVGVRYSKGGSYEDQIEAAIVEAATKLNWTSYQFPYPEFGAWIPKVKP